MNVYADVMAYHSRTSLRTQLITKSTRYVQLGTEGKALGNTQMTRVIRRNGIPRAFGGGGKANPGKPQRKESVMRQAGKGRLPRNAKER